MKKFGAIISHDQYPILKAIVVFQTLKDKNDTLKLYLKFHKFCCGLTPTKKQLFQQKYLLDLNSKVDEPSNIKWENLVKK